jgi:NitT/TauT family transport system permease protein
MAIDLPSRTTAEITGLDALDLGGGRARSRAEKIWSAAWPKLAAIGLALAIWQAVVLSGWRPEWVLPGPATVFDELLRQVKEAEFWSAVATTGRRAVTGFAFAVVLGLALGLAVSRSRILRAAIGSFITGLQTMPSIAWFPLAIVLFKLSEGAIFFVVVLGAAPSIANGVISGVDYVPPVLVRAGRNLGARGLRLYRYVIGPASLPAIVAGLKQGWAFAWRSLMAGELIVIIANRPSLGVQLASGRELSDSALLVATMIVILVLGILVDVLFNVVNNRIRRRWGLADAVP